MYHRLLFPLNPTNRGATISTAEMRISRTSLPLASWSCLVVDRFVVVKARWITCCSTTGDTCGVRYRARSSPPRRSELLLTFCYSKLNVYFAVLCDQYSIRIIEYQLQLKTEAQLKSCMPQENSWFVFCLRGEDDLQDDVHACSLQQAVMQGVPGNATCSLQPATNLRPHCRLTVYESVGNRMLHHANRGRGREGGDLRSTAILLLATHHIMLGSRDPVKRRESLGLL